jgi:hypothetical protein
MNLGDSHDCPRRIWPNPNSPVFSHVFVWKRRKEKLKICGFVERAVQTSES